MKEKIRSTIRNWARFHYWDSATINDLTDEILKLYQPSEKPTLSEDKFFDCFGHSHTPRFVDEKPSAEEWFKQNYSKSYEKMLKAAKYYVKPRMDMELVFYIMEQYAKQ